MKSPWICAIVKRTSEHRFWARFDCGHRENIFILLHKVADVSIRMQLSKRRIYFEKYGIVQAQNPRLQKFNEEIS